ncbi:hypothetical protein LTR66_017318, partial [Elasticomyces elasticus]
HSYYHKAQHTLSELQNNQPETMYRKSDGKVGFSSQNLLFNDYPGALSSSSGLDPGSLPLNQKDSVYLYQLQHSNPCALTTETFHVSRIIDNESNSKKVFHKLQKLKLFTTAGEVDTATFDDPKFGKHLTSKLAFTSVARQKQVVDFLFWWNDEAARLRKLIGEEEELQGMTASGQGVDQDVKSLLDRVNAKIGARPSQRNAEIEQDVDFARTEDRPPTGSSEGLPEYKS